MLGAGGATRQAITVGGRTGTPLWWATRAAVVGDEGRCGGGGDYNIFPQQEQVAGAVKLAKLLVEKGARVNAVGADEDGHESTPLWWAVLGALNQRGALQLPTLLVEHGANVNAVGSAANGQFPTATPLWIAVFKYTMVEENWEAGFDMVKLLVEKDARVNYVAAAEGRSASETYKCAPLWLAAKAVYDGRARAVEMATLLVHKGADANKVGEWGREDESTPLRRAAEAVRDGKAGGPELARLLISAGARLADDEKDAFQGFIDKMPLSPLSLTLLARTSTSLTVSWPGGLAGRGLHSSTFRLNVSALCGIVGVAFRGCLGDV